MQQTGPEGYIPDEGGEGPAPSEQVGERAGEQFAQSQAAAQQDRRDEQKARKRDDGIAQLIVQFLTDDQKAHFAVLIARLAARDCPSIFLLALLSLINDACRSAVEEALREHGMASDTGNNHAGLTLPANAALSPEANAALAGWIVRVERVMALHEETIIRALVVDDHTIDGTVLQLTTFVLRDFLAAHGRSVAHEQLQALSAGLLQALFRPALQAWKERQLSEKDYPPPTSGEG